VIPLYVLAIIGSLALIGLGGGLVASVVLRSEAEHAKRKEAGRRKADPIADMVETKAAIRTDELMRWAEAWRRAAELPDLSTTIREIQVVESNAMIAHRRRERDREIVAREEARIVEIEERERRRLERLQQAEEERQARIAHEEQLAARRARYAARRAS
jgi:hypothetical protein